MIYNIVEEVKKPSVAVITPTIGKECLARAMTSVAAQTFKGIHHYIVIDGGEHFENALKNGSIEKNSDSNVSFHVTPTNTGKNGFYGHRIYAAYPHLINEDIILFLDDDNWFEPNHVESLVNLIQKNNLDWAHSLRHVWTDENTYLAEDCCESIGRYPIWFSQYNEKGGQQFLADTSTYAFKTKWLIKHSHNFHHGWGGDRIFLNSVMHNSSFDTTGLHTLNYVLPDMNNAYGGDFDFFKRGNEAVKKHYGGEFPWKIKK